MKLLREMTYGALLCVLTLALVWLIMMQSAQKAHADLVTEIGGGYKFGESGVLRPECALVTVLEARGGFERDPNTGAIRTMDCGGDNPVFVGWPLAWDFKNGNTRFGWFHMSNWLDGGELSRWTHTGDNHETSFNCLCASHTFHWSRRAR